MLTYSFDKSNRNPLYEQLYELIRNDIISGNIKGGEKLPSKRLFAEHLGISKVTVENAYSLLVSEGYICTKPRKGYFAEEGLKAPEKTSVKFDRGKQDGEESFIDLMSNVVPSDQFPFSTWTKLLRNVCLDYRNELLLPVAFNGCYYLRETICRYLFEQRGMNVTPDRIIIGAGSEFLYSNLCKIIGNGKIIGTEDPTYHKIRSIYFRNNISTVPLALDSEGVNMNEVKRLKPDIIHISPAHNFPTGIITSVKRRNDLLFWADESEDRYIIEDDFDSELRITGKPLPTLFSSDRNDKIIYINTFSKIIAPSVRIGFMILPEKLGEKYREEFGGDSCSVSSFEQYTLAAFMEKGYFERHINRTKKYYRLLRESLFDIINDSGMKNRCVIRENNSGLHFMLELFTEKSDEEIKNELRKKGIKAAFLSDYCGNSDGTDSHRLLVNYSGLKKEDFGKFIEILNKTVNEV